MNAHLDEFRKLDYDDAIKCATTYRGYVFTSKSFKDGTRYFNSEVRCEGNKIGKTMLPILATQHIDFTEVECLQRDNPKNTITVAILDSSSNVLHHTVTRGFVDKERNCTP